MEYLWYTINITQDTDCESPREWDNVWTLVTAHRNYSGDEELPHDCESMEDAFEEHLEWEDLSLEEVYYREVYLYEHSWISVSTSQFNCRWDSWQWWYIYTSKSRLTKEHIDFKTEEDIKKVYEYLDWEIDLLDKYYKGEVYSYWIDILDEYCWWYYSEEEAISEAKDIIDTQDPEWKTFKYALELYSNSMDNFWDNANEKIFRDIITEDWEEDEQKKDLIINIIWEKLREY